MRIEDLARCQRCGDTTTHPRRGLCFTCASRDQFVERLGNRAVADRRPVRHHGVQRR